MNDGVKIYVFVNIMLMVFFVKQDNKNQEIIMTEAKNILSDVCVSCILIGIGIVSVVSMVILIWTQMI